jgi:hypothetical protein
VCCLLIVDDDNNYLTVLKQLVTITKNMLLVSCWGHFLRDWESVHKKLKAGQPTGENLIRNDKANKFRTFVEYLSALLL